jgi:choline dehydrogenase-like flavoprotein
MTVLTSPRGGVERTDGACEVILSAGVIGSPHILQLPGVGAPEHLTRVGIAVHHALPGVGRNLQDHYIARISYPIHGVPTVNERSRGMALAAEVLRYLVTGKGMLTYSASLAGASVKVLEESSTPDVQCSIAPGSFKDGQIGAPGRTALRAVPGVDDFPGITAGAWEMRRCHAAMSRRDRRTRPRRRRSTRVISPTRPTGGRSSAGSASSAGSLPRRRSPAIAAPRSCRVRRS